MEEAKRSGGFDTFIAIIAGVLIIAGFAYFYLHKFGNVKHFDFYAQTIALSAAAPLAAAAGFGFAAMIYAKKSKKRADLKESAGTLLAAFALAAFSALVIGGFSVYEGKIYTMKYLQTLKMYKHYIYIPLEAFAVIFVSYVVYKLAMQKRGIEIVAEKVAFFPVIKRKLITRRVRLEDGSEYFATEDPEDTFDPDRITEKDRAVMRLYIYLYKALKGRTDLSEVSRDLVPGVKVLMDLAGEHKINVPLGYLYSYDPELAGALESIYRKTAIRNTGKSIAIEYLVKKGEKDETHRV